MSDLVLQNSTLVSVTTLVLQNSTMVSVTALEYNFPFIKVICHQLFIPEMVISLVNMRKIQRVQT